MSVGSRTVTAVVGSVIVLAGTWYVLNHKQQFSTWWNNLIGQITNQTSSSSSPPAAPTKPAPHPTQTHTAPSTASPGGSTSVHNAPSPWYNTNPYNKNPNYPPGPSLTNTTTPAHHYAPVKTADQSKPSPHQGTIPNVNSPEVNPFVTPPPMLIPHPAQTPPPTHPSHTAPTSVTQTHRYVPVSPGHAPTSQSPVNAPPSHSVSQVHPPSTLPIRQKQPPGPTPRPSARKNPNIKTPRNGAICGDLSSAVCGSTCIAKGGHTKMYVACNPGAPKAYQQMGVERGWF